ncbi:MAG: sel1 repeat family protein [Lentisphaerae bacterium]|nr:sel1 repeat family protein [Lentisphaerota bacterium]
MASITWDCPHCQQNLEAEQDMAGEQIDCPTCGKSIWVPETDKKGPKLRLRKQPTAPPSRGHHNGAMTDEAHAATGIVFAAFAIPAVLGVLILLARLVAGPNPTRLWAIIPKPWFLMYLLLGFIGFVLTANHFEKLVSAKPHTSPSPLKSIGATSAVVTVLMCLAMVIMLQWSHSNMVTQRFDNAIRLADEAAQRGHPENAIPPLVQVVAWYPDFGAVSHVQDLIAQRHHDVAEKFRQTAKTPKPQVASTAAPEPSAIPVSPKDVSPVISDLVRRAQSGIAQAQYELGRKYEDGDGVSTNSEKAFEWITKAAQQGFTDAEKQLGDIYRDGIGVQINLPLALHWYLKAANKGHAKAQVQVGERYWFGEGTATNTTLAVEWFRKAAIQGNAYAQHNLGYAYENGIAVPRDMGEALRWYKSAANKGQVNALLRLGDSYATGDLLDKDLTVAFSFYLRAAEAGQPRAQRMVGSYLSLGTGVDIDTQAAADWFRKAAENGDVVGMRCFGFSLANGVGVERNAHAGVDWLRRAAEQNDAAAQRRLGYAYDLGEGVKQDFAQAAHWYQAAADQGDAIAQCDLGSFYLNGKGVAEDAQQAASLYLSSATQGNVNAQYFLGLCNLHGDGVPVDYQAAGRWFLKAAEQGDSDAQYHLGWMYYNGRGVHPDESKGLYWINKAATQGVVLAVAFLTDLKAQAASQNIFRTTIFGQSYQSISRALGEGKLKSYSSGISRSWHDPTGFRVLVTYINGTAEWVSYSKAEGEFTRNELEQILQSNAQGRQWGYYDTGWLRAGFPEVSAVLHTVGMLRGSFVISTKEGDHASIAASKEEWSRGSSSVSPSTSQAESSDRSSHDISPGSSQPPQWRVNERGIDDGVRVFDENQYLAQHYGRFGGSFDTLTEARQKAKALNTQQTYNLDAMKEAVVMGGAGSSSGYGDFEVGRWKYTFDGSISKFVVYMK